MEPLFGKTLEELQQVAGTLELPGFSAKQMADWLYKKKIGSIDEMTNLSKDARAKLNAK
jgi:23S rRNA (adenine2503-C2)-methyltransferase